MRHIFISIILITLMTCGSHSSAQVPYFSGTVGNDKLYGYTSLKVRPGINSQETYTTFQYGTSSQTAVGLDLYTCNGASYMGYIMRAGYKFNQWFGIGAQITPSFNLSDNYNFSYLTSALYLNGNITRDGKFFWCSNTWWGINKSTSNTIYNWEYLGVAIPLKNGHSITPMLGAIHSWKFDTEIDIAAGLYYTIGNWNLYLWGNDFLKANPRVIIGCDFVF